MNDIWSPITIGKMHPPHPLAMTPMTGSRAKPEGTPGDLAADDYAQRASIGLLIAEGTQPSDDGQDYLSTPGIYTDAHVAGRTQHTASSSARRPIRNRHRRRHVHARRQAAGADARN